MLGCVLQKNKENKFFTSQIVKRLKRLQNFCSPIAAMENAMLEIFTHLADWAILQMCLSKETHLGSAVHFFIEDSTKIFVLLYLLIFIISLFRSQLSPERVRDYLSGKSRWSGYFLAVFLGVVTPFCSCSSYSFIYGIFGSRRSVWRRRGLLG